ncbi:malonyl-CoA decarboxylase [Vibrio rarus]|uniref:malonyl-CoA decarboxylase n=1 Tax=Vibrio rarus TaxID=413403 RepID=UPI0021C49801|nr:malonyl-CoA decarboxylase [Vibrio rarus]
MANWMNVIEDWVSRVTDIGGTLIAHNTQLTLIDKCHRLLENSGEATSLALSREILQDFTQLTMAEKKAFFESLIEEFSIDPEALNGAIAHWQSAPSIEQGRALHFAIEPKSQELIRQLNRAPGGTAALVAMREDLLILSREHAHLRCLDNDLKHLFHSWFNRGFLRLEVINWSTSARVLEKIIAYEAVHEIQGWDDLRRRVAEKDRRLYAFFHPSLPSDPLIFVEVALTAATPETIESILQDNRQPLEANQVTTAVFYSISNCQAGLRGISFGNFLIKQVVEELSREMPNLRRFITMSPIPGMRRWLEAQRNLTAEQQNIMQQSSVDQGNLTEAVKKQNSQGLYRLAIHYLLEAKGKDGGPVDPVSRFHLGNGAHLEKVHLWANSSTRGVNDSYGVMVNYEYDLPSIERNHEEFLSQGTIKTSSLIKKVHKKTHRK